MVVVVVVVVFRGVKNKQNKLAVFPHGLHALVKKE